MAALIEIKTQDEAEARIEALQNMTVSELRRQWVLLFGNKPYTTRNRIFLIKRLTWRINTLLHGGLSDRALKRAEEIADESLIRMRPRNYKTIEQDVVAPNSTPLNVPANELPAGTVIQREFKGVQHTVTVLKDHRFVYDGRVYKSLTEIAWKICGYPKSGNYFFNLPMKPRTRNAYK